MARQPNNTSVEQFTDADQDNTALVEIRQENNAVAAADAVIMGAEEALKMIGRIEASVFMATVAEKMIAETAITLKQSKQYKGLPFIDENNNRRQIATFEEFCQYKLGKSRRRVDELVSNYNVLGPELYEQAERLGFRQRDYNALKALPIDDRKLIAQAIEEESLDRAIDLMQEMAAKHHREKEQTSKQLDELTKSVEAKDSVIKGKSEELDKKNEQLARLQLEKTSKVDEVAMPGEYQLMRLQEYSRELTVKITATLNSEIVKLYNEFGGQPPKHIELAARQAVGLVITAAYGVAENMGIDPILEPEQAADDPAKADAEAFLAYQSSLACQQDSDLMDEADSQDTRKPLHAYSDDDWDRLKNPEA
jgi:hypothetical protein